MSVGCDYFLTCVTSSSTEEVGESSSLYSVLVVCEFTDIFSENLPRLPPQCEVEFAIELYPHIMPSSKEP